MYSAAPNGAPACWSRKTVKSRFGRQIRGLDLEPVEAELVGGEPHLDVQLRVRHAGRELCGRRREVDCCTSSACFTLCARTSDSLVPRVAPNAAAVIVATTVTTAAATRRCLYRCMSYVLPAWLVAVSRKDSAGSPVFPRAAGTVVFGAGALLQRDNPHGSHARAQTALLSIVPLRALVQAWPRPAHRLNSSSRPARPCDAN